MAGKFASVDWSAVDAKLPTLQDPESRRIRKALFKTMDPTGDNLLSITEVQNSLVNLMDKEDLRKAGETASALVPTECIKPAIKCAFACAKDLAPTPKAQHLRPKTPKAKAGQTTVDMREFHGLLVAFRKYLELAVLFKRLDKSRDMTLNYKECEAALPLLEQWGLQKKKVRAKFPDEWTESMKFETFADWCIQSSMGSLDLKLDDSDDEEVQDRALASEVLDEAGAQNASNKRDADLINAQNRRKCAELFMRLDTDNSGTLSEEELTQVFVQLSERLGKPLTPENTKRLLQAADSNKDGHINFDELMTWLFK